MTMLADDARERFQKIRVSFPQPPAGLDLAGALNVRQSGRELEILADGNSPQLIEKLRARHPEDLRCESLTLEEIFIAAGTLAKSEAIMKPLYAKEIRLLQPAYLMALLLAVVPVWLLPRQPYDFPESTALVASCSAW